MLQSLFYKYLERFFPRLQRLIETVNKKRGNSLTYLHKQHLNEEYSPDNKWESTISDTTYVAADFVSMDSALPIKQRDTIQTANGKLPKIGISRVLRESDINTLNTMEAQGGNAQLISRKLANDPVACAQGLDERNEYNFLSGFSNGYVAIKDDDNPNALMRINFNYLDKNTFSSSNPGSPELEDILNVIEKAEENGTTIRYIWISKQTYDELRHSAAARELAANYERRIVGNGITLPVPTPTLFDEAFSDETNGVSFVKVNRSVIIEENGIRKNVKPWNDNRIIFVEDDIVGTLVYGRLAETTNPVENVLYQLVDNYKLIARFRETNPLRETTTGQAIVAPIIENIDQIYVLDISQGQEVDQTAEAADTNDTFVTVWGNKYNKAAFITAYNALEGEKTPRTLKEGTTDVNIIKAVNKLSVEQVEKLQAALTPVTNG